MYIWLILALLFAFLEAVAVVKNLQRWEYISKPAVMILLFVWLYASTGLQGNAVWFGLGILFSLAGDILLLSSLEEFFLPGLVAFLLTHIFYIIGLRTELALLNGWSLIVLVIMVVNVNRLIRRIVGAMRARKQDNLVLPVVVYGTVISVMLYAALVTVYDQTWKSNAAFFVTAGASLFWISDLILAWNTFVSPIRNGRVWNIALYHVGQIALVAGAISQFG